MRNVITIPEAKERITIPHLWAILTLSGDPPIKDGVYQSPFRDDSSPSFSIFAGGRRFKDHGTGEGGDAITFLALARGIDNRDAVKEFVTIASRGL
ncbi:CHC2 zinc finger domain-containing protein [Verrucomicrobiales bacterium]|nr:CHC2 zinc finger domain-containing protein [Verrucomicrobiales bacterium]